MKRFFVIPLLLTLFFDLPTVQAQTPTIRLDAIVRSYWDTPNPADSNCGPGGQPLGQYTVDLDGGAGALMSWINAPAGTWISECWTTEFHQVGLAAGDLVKVCTTGDFPYWSWSDSSTRWPAQFNWRTDTVWPNESGPISDEYGGRCMAGHFGGGTTLTLGYRWGWEGRYVCNNSPDCPNPHTFSYHVFIAEVNGVPVPQPALADLQTLSGMEAKNGQGDPRESATTTCTCSQGYAGDPINTRTGGFDYTWVDLAIPTSAGPLVFQRTYASPATNIYTSTLGYGWTHNQDTRLSLPPTPGAGQIIQFKSHSANQYAFIDNGNGSYTPGFGVSASLTYNAGTSKYKVVNSDQAVYTFDAGGKLLTWADPQGHVLNYTYASGRLTQVSANGGARYLNFAYDAQSRLSAVSDHAGRQVSFSYDLTTGDLITATDVLNQTWTYVYSGTTHRLWKVIDPRGVTAIQTEYDPQGRALRQYNAQNKLILQVAYNPLSGTSILTNALGITETHTYDSHNTLIGESGALNQSVAKTYNSNFRPTSVTDALGHTTGLAWNLDGTRLTRVTDAISQTTTLTYDALGNLTQTVNARGFTTTLSYTGTLPTSSVDALGSTTRYTYTTALDAPQPSGLLKMMSDPLGNTTRYQYDTFGQRTMMTDAVGIATTYGYDNLGRVVTTTTAGGTPLQQVTLNQYDAAGRVVKTTENYLAAQPQNHLNRYNLVTQFGYDAVNNPTLMTDTVGLVTRNIYDNNNRLIQTTQNYLSGQPQNHLNQYNLITTYGYNDLGLPVAITDTVGHVTRTEYDAATRPVTTTVNYVDGFFDSAKPDEDLQTVTQSDANGNIIATTQLYGSAQQHTKHIWYDALNRPLTVTANYTGTGAFVPFNPANPDLNISTLTRYDAVGNVISTTQFYSAGNLARTALIQYNALNRPVTTTLNYVDGFFTPTEPDKDLQSVNHYDALGHVDFQTVYANVSGFARKNYIQYDAANRPVKVTANYTGAGAFNPNFPDQNLTQAIAYGPAGERQSTTELRGGPGLGTTPITTTYGYDNLGRLLTATWPLTGTSLTSATVTYDALSRVVDRLDPLGHVTRTQYDALSRPVTVTVNYQDGFFNPAKPDEDLITLTYYDAASNRTSVTDPKGIVTAFQYDALNRLKTVIENYKPGFQPTSAINVQTEYTYDAAGNLKTVKDARGKVTTYTYDRLNRQLSVTDPLNHTATYGYDGAGNLIRSTDANGATTNYTYDLLDQLKTIDYPAPDADVTFTYNAAGERTRMVDGAGTTTWSYDQLSRPITVTDPFSGTVIYGYDSAGDRTSLKYPDGKVVTYTYDLANRLTQVTDWQSRVTAYTYDSSSRLITTALPNGITSAYNYDHANRLLNLTHQKSGQTLASYTYTYDPVGNRTSASEIVGSLVQIYLPLLINDGSGDLGDQSSAPLIMPTEDMLDEPYPGPVVETPSATFSASDTPMPTVTDIPSLTPSATLPPSLTPTGIATPPSTSTFIPSATLGSSPTATRTPKPSSTPKPTRASASGGILARPVSPHGEQPSPLSASPLLLTTTTISYTYDALNRLTGADYADGKYFHYTYDAAGNRLTQQNHLSTTNYAYDDANRLTSVNGVTHTWDNNGNLLNDGLNTYTYDKANRLSSVVGLAQWSSVSFTYNGLGDRLQQTAAGSTSTTYTLDLATGLPQVLADGTNTYLYGNTRIAQQSATNTDYFLGDALGSVRQLTNATGQVVLTRSYDPFGNVIGSAGIENSAYSFAGEWADTSTGFTYLRTRYYNPEWGRFLTHDSFPGYLNSPQTLNPYSYGLANPVRYTDPSGRCVDGISTAFCFAVIGAAVGATANYGYQVYQNYQHGLTGSDAWFKCINGWSIAGWAIVGAGAGGLAGVLGPAIFANPLSWQTLISWQFLLPVSAAGTLVAGWMGTDGYGGQQLQGIPLVGPVAGAVAQVFAALWGIQGVKHSLSVLDNQESRIGSKIWALASLGLIAFGDVTMSKGLVALPKVFNLSKTLQGATDPLKVLRNYVAEAFPKRSLKVETWGEASSYFYAEKGVETQTIYLSNQALQSGSKSLASTFLHEAAHAEQYYGGGLMNGFRQLSAWTMPIGSQLGRPPIIGTFLYAMNPAEYAAAASGSFFARANALFLWMPRIVGDTISAVNDHPIP